MVVREERDDGKRRGRGKRRRKQWSLRKKGRKKTKQRFYCVFLLSWGLTLIHSCVQLEPAEWPNGY